MSSVENVGPIRHVEGFMKNGMIGHNVIKNVVNHVVNLLPRIDNLGHVLVSLDPIITDLDHSRFNDRLLNHDVNQ